VARYRLFNLDRWWFEALIWGLGGALVVLFDVVLLWLNASAGVALGTALASPAGCTFRCASGCGDASVRQRGCRSSAICRS
jgi:hypothetical protein